MATGHGSAITFGTSGYTLPLISLTPSEETVADIEEPHLGLDEGDNIPYSPGDLVEGGQYEAVLEDDRDTFIALRAIETITWTKPLNSGDTTAASRAFDGYINKVQNNQQATSERSTITVGIKVAGNFTDTNAS